MELYKIENLTFKYPTSDNIVLNDISLSVNCGELVTVCGKSGCGKSTLLRQLKPAISSHGIKSGRVLFMNNDIEKLDLKTQSEKIGFVTQNPDNQIVTDKVWHELAFGLESLGIPSSEIRARVAEMASYFGLQTWFHKKTSELSGGQKQLLNLASVMVMQPSVLILDEPTSQLDPIAAQEFLETVSKINHELGTTVILAEHRLETAFTLSSRVIVMDNGAVIVDGTPRETGEILKSINHDMLAAMPTAMRVFAGVVNSLECPITICEGKAWLENISKEREIIPKTLSSSVKKRKKGKVTVKIDDVWFRYSKESPDIICGLSSEIHSGELYAVIGGNGTGKTTFLSLISGINRPYRGRILINDENAPDIHRCSNRIVGVLPQNPQALFVKKNVLLDLHEMLTDKKLSKSERDTRISEVIRICELESILDKHPYDISGGEQQRAALAKILLLKPQVLLMDEPTKGMDAHFKKKFAEIISSLKHAGVTIIMVSHDIEFCAEYADRCAMLFDGKIVSEGTPEEFFPGKSFYTTAANRMARDILPNAVLAEDIILSCGGELQDNEITHPPQYILCNIESETNNVKKKIKPSKIKTLWGILFAVMFLFVVCTFQNKFCDWRNGLIQLSSLLFLALSLSCLIPQKALDANIESVQMPESNRKLSKRTLAAMVITLLVIPLTIYTGIYFFDDKKYYFISMLIILETMLPFCMVFEQRKPQARELIVISVLCAVSVAGRTAFFMLPQFKPLIAMIIISGVCFGGETGFLVGAVSGFVSNFYFGQGPWTPWQMFSLGIIGFLAGVLFRKGWLRKTRIALCTFGGIATVVIYGGIMNPASVIMIEDNPTLPMIYSAYAMGIPFDLIHAAATVFFLWVASGPMIEKLDRIKVKYGLIE